MSDQNTPTSGSHLVTSEVLDLNALAARIRGRDEEVKTLAASARRNWLDNGRDLITAKSLVGHGGFEKWCKTAVHYSLRTAEKLMQAVRTFEPLLKSESGSDLPPPSLVYALSAPSVPQELRDAYAPRIVAGEKYAGSEFRAALKKHRQKLERDEARAALSSEARGAQKRREESKAKRVASQIERYRADQARRAHARSAAAALILARIGDDLPKLMALMAEACDYSALESELQARAQSTATLPVSSDIGSREAIETALRDEEAVTVEGDRTTLSEQVTDQCPIDFPTSATPASDGAPIPIVSRKYGNLSPIVKSFSPAIRSGWPSSVN